MKTWEPEYTANPYLFAGRLRDSEPVAQVRVDGLTVWLVSGYDEIQQALLDPALRNDPRHAGPAAAAAAWTGASQATTAMRHMLRSDPPDHTRLRRLVSKAFTSRRVEQLRPRIEQLAADLIAGFAGQEEIDLLQRYAAPLPITVISELFGIAPADLDSFVYWSEVYAGTREGDADKVPAAVAWLSGHLAELINGLGRPGGEPAAGSGLETGTLLEGLMRARDAGDYLNEAELLSMAFLILVAGYETTVNLIASGSLLLLSDRRRFEAVSADRSLLGPAIEECLRMEPPVKVSAAVRYAVHDTVIAGVKIPAGDAVLMHFGAANRDPRQFPDPDDFDLNRYGPRQAEPSRPHLAFSHGVHYCLGAPLARLEAEIALTALMDAFPRLALSQPQVSLQWRTSRMIRGLRSLPVTLR
jgi:cytochrome P450